MDDGGLVANHDNEVGRCVHAVVSGNDEKHKMITDNRRRDNVSSTMVYEQRSQYRDDFVIIV